MYRRGNSKSTYSVSGKVVMEGVGVSDITLGLAKIMARQQIVMDSGVRKALMVMSRLLP